MDSSSVGVLDPLKCSKLSMEEKRELVYQISKWSHGGPEVLQSWSRQEILQILCAEMGKERKYTGLTKLKIIEHLLKIVSEKKLADHEDLTDHIESPFSSAISQRTYKRQRKTENPSQIPVTSNNSSISNGDTSNLGNAIYCKNMACKASLSREDVFCKRCSCCLCYKFDDNKDPSLWLTCSSEGPTQGGDPCGMSCHLECAIRDERCGIAKHGRYARLDGSFYCASCTKMNDLLRSWRKQMTVAKETRRADTLCYRISLTHKLLVGTGKYQKLYDIVDDAVKKLEQELGPLTGVPFKTARGIVNRLSSGPQVQRLCGDAVELLDAMLSNTDSLPQPSPVIQDLNYKAAPNIIKFETISPTSVALVLNSQDTSSPETIVGYTMWHRKASVLDYRSEPTCTLFAPNSKFQVSDLIPSTEYIFKIVSFGSNTTQLDISEVPFTTGNMKRLPSSVTNGSSLSNPSSEEDETNNAIPTKPDSNMEKKQSETQMTEPDSEPSSKPDSPIETRIECAPSQPADLPITPCRLENFKDGSGRNGRPKLGNDGPGKQREDPDGNGPSDRDFEYYVKVIRWLECEGHIEKNFRQKFLTWYSLRANPQEVRIVKAFVDTLIDDPIALSGQLVDAFLESVSSKRESNVPAGFCLKLWH